MWVQRVPGGGVTALAYAPDGRTLYTLDGGWWVTAWDTAARTGTRLFRLDPTDRLRFTRLDVTADGRFLLLPRMEGGTVWNLVTGNPGPRLPPRVGAVGGCVPDRTATRVWHIGVGSRTLESWDVEAGTPGPSVSGWPSDISPTAFDLAPDGKSAAVACMWVDATAPALLTPRVVLFSRPAGAVVTDFTLDDFAYRLLFSADSRTLLAIGSNWVLPWDVLSRTPRTEAVRCLEPFRVFSDHPTAPIFAARNLGGVLTLFSLESGQPLRSLDFGLGRHVQYVAFAPDGLTCAVGGSNKQFVVFDVDL